MPEQNETPTQPPAEAPTTPSRPLRSFVIIPAIGAKPGFVWVEADETPGKGRVFVVKMKFGKEIERVRLTKTYKKLGARQVREEVDPVIGDLLFNEREHGALTEEQAREVIARASAPRRPPPRGPRGPGGGGHRGGGGPRGGGPGGPRGGGGGGGPRGPRPDRPPRDQRDSAPRSDNPPPQH